MKQLEQSIREKQREISGVELAETAEFSRSFKSIRGRLSKEKLDGLGMMKKRVPRHGLATVTEDKLDDRESLASKMMDGLKDGLLEQP